MSNLSFRVCLAGIETINENSLRLWKESHDLLGRGTFLSAGLLGCYSFDEFGKMLIVAKTMFAAQRQGKSQISEGDLRNAGFFLHGPKLNSVSQILAPLMTGMPPGLAATADAIESWEKDVWTFRNAVAYVNVCNGAFQSPTTITRDRCEEVLNTLSEFKTIVQERVKPYLDGEFKRLNIF